MQFSAILAFEFYVAKILRVMLAGAQVLGRSNEPRKLKTNKIELKDNNGFPFD